MVGRSANEVGTGVSNSVFDLVAIEFGRDPPEGMIRVLVRPSDGTGELEKVDPANVQRSFASRTKGELIGARLDEVLLLGGPSKRKLLDVKGAVFGIGEGEAKSAAIATVKVAIAMTDGDIGSLDTTDGDLVGIQITSHMLRAIGEIEPLVEIL